VRSEERGARSVCGLLTFPLQVDLNHECHAYMLAKILTFTSGVNLTDLELEQFLLCLFILQVLSIAMTALILPAARPSQT